MEVSAVDQFYFGVCALERLGYVQSPETAPNNDDFLNVKIPELGKFTQSIVLY